MEKMKFKQVKAKESFNWNNDSLEVERILWDDGTAFIQAKYIKNYKEVKN